MNRRSSSRGYGELLRCCRDDTGRATTTTAVKLSKEFETFHFTYYGKKGLGADDCRGCGLTVFFVALTASSVASGRKPGEGETDDFLWPVKEDRRRRIRRNK